MMKLAAKLSHVSTRTGDNRTMKLFGALSLVATFKQTILKSFNIVHYRKKERKVVYE